MIRFITFMSRYYYVYMGDNRGRLGENRPFCMYACVYGERIGENRGVSGCIL